jgi:hypothetical protein
MGDDAIDCFRQNRDTKTKNRSGTVGRFELQRLVRAIVGSLDVDALHRVNDMRDVVLR